MSGGAVSTNTVKVVPTDWVRPVEVKPSSTGNTVSQVKNTGVAVSTNPITPSNIIVARATQETNQVAKVEAVKPSKKEFVMDISKYFQTIYFELEEGDMLVYAQRCVLLPEFTQQGSKVSPPIPPPLSLWTGKPKNLLTIKEMADKFVEVHKDEINNAFNYKREHGALLINDPAPEWLTKKVELLAKQHVFFYASHKDLEDYGMDMDYLTIPVIDHEIIDKKLYDYGYKNFPFVRYLSTYDKLLSEYNGVSTVGKLGREIGISGVELYNLWKELNMAGIVTTLNWEHKNEKGAVTAKIAKKWLEVSSNVNVKALIASLDVNPNIKPKLEKYLLTLQQGKKRDENFINRYEQLKVEYNRKVLIDNYYLTGFGIFSALNVEFNNDNLNKIYAPKADKWIQEYDSFNSSINSMFRTLARVPEEYVGRTKAIIDKLIEAKNEEFNGKIPLGQEFLFSFLESLENIPLEDLNRGIYEIKVK